MSQPSFAATGVPATPRKRLAFSERYLTVRVFLCMVVGVLLGKLAPALTATLSRMEFGRGPQLNVPIAVLIWRMICPMMLRVDFGAVGGIARRPKGLLITLFGPGSPAALATVVGVLVEVPVMRSACRVCNDSRPWYNRALQPS